MASGTINRDTLGTNQGNLESSLLGLQSSIIGPEFNFLGRDVTGALNRQGASPFVQQDILTGIRQQQIQDLIGQVGNLSQRLNQRPTGALPEGVEVAFREDFESGQRTPFLRQKRQSFGEIRSGLLEALQSLGLT